ncbi:hypothetical protein EJ06DRAFT_578912 [Trichodelitschia bisporula]|uniref:Zn(2)-C6 fungal-type domain-containing protein n=1 Tax=Trichodelitschia bisporula TaxID=703511 RepID=A0A6G1I7G5_9PEZI|nr:hypothetical protein EJ06DRAFT_578912 [Trichodelitschia bisporula]
MGWGVIAELTGQTRPFPIRTRSPLRRPYLPFPRGPSLNPHRPQDIFFAMNTTLHGLYLHFPPAVPTLVYIALQSTMPSRLRPPVTPRPAPSTASQTPDGASSEDSTGHLLWTVAGTPLTPDTPYTPCPPYTPASRSALADITNTASANNKENTVPPTFLLTSTDKTNAIPQALPLSSTPNRRTLNTPFEHQTPLYSPSAIFLQVPCLQCVLKRLPCDQRLPSCSRCRRAGDGAVCLVQRVITHQEREDWGVGFGLARYVTLVRLGEGEGEWGEKKGVEEVLLERLQERLDRENWVLPVNDGRMGAFVPFCGGRVVDEVRGEMESRLYGLFAPRKSSGFS